MASGDWTFRRRCVGESQRARDFRGPPIYGLDEAKATVNCQFGAKTSHFMKERTTVKLSDEVTIAISSFDDKDPAGFAFAVSKSCENSKKFSCPGDPIRDLMCPQWLQLLVIFVWNDSIKSALVVTTQKDGWA